MKLLLITDAWEPQTNGVVTTLKQVIPHLHRRGLERGGVPPRAVQNHPVTGLSGDSRSARCVAHRSPHSRERADTIHIATEGPLGIAARLYLTRRSIPFCTSLHTKFPEYVSARTGLPSSVGYAFLRWFHAPAESTLVTTTSHKGELERWGLRHLVVWGRGVDTALVHASSTHAARATPAAVRRPHCGREEPRSVPELQFDATKVVVGDGPARKELQSRHPNVEWAGYRYGAELAAYYADADVFVFPSRTDTFGLVMLEAMACGTPVAAYPVTGPADVVMEGVNGALDTDFGAAVRRALTIDRRGCRSFALQHGWEAIAERMLANQTPIDRRRSNLQIA